MIVVKVELWPFGNPNEAQEIGRAYIANDGTGSQSTGNYNVQLQHAGKYAKRKGFWRQGKLLGHSRMLSPYHLVMRAFQACLGTKESK
jgi:hypothetical protein